VRGERIKFVIIIMIENVRVLSNALAFSIFKKLIENLLQIICF
jgi:hypothetical protein